MDNLPQTRKQTFDFMIPETYERAKEIAEGLAKSKMIPQHFQNNPTDIIIAMSYGAQLGLSPIIALNGIAVINGTPSLWGVVFWGMVLSCPAVTDVKEEWDDSKKEWTVTIFRRDFKQPFVRSFSFEDATQAGLLNESKKSYTWGKYPKDMTLHKARARAGKAAISDYLCGLGLAEDIRDAIDVQIHEHPNQIQVDNIEAEVTETEPTKPRPGTKENTAPDSNNKVTPEVQTGVSPIDGLIEKITKEFEVSITDLCNWFKREKVTTEMGRISRIEQALELLETGVPWSTISGEDRQTAKKKKDTKPKPPQEKKAVPKKETPAQEPGKDSPKIIRDRVIALVGSGKVSHDELLKLMGEIFPKLNGESFLNIEWLPNSNFVPDSHIKKMDDCFREAEMYN